MRYQVPQFTDVEDKIFGPLTLKQFVYVAGGGGLSFLFWNYLPIFISLPLILGVMAFSSALAFMKVNKKPLIVTVEAAFMYFLRGKLYLWSTHYAEEKQKRNHSKKDSSKSLVESPAISENKLTHLAWSLDINEHLSKKQPTDINL